MSRIVWTLAVAAASLPAVADVMYWVSGQDADGTYRIYQFDDNGVYIGVAVEQIPAAQTGGYRDGMTDREGRLYFGWDNGVARHYFNGQGGRQIISGPAPGGVGTWRGLAYDPAGDRGRGSIWTQSFGSGLAQTTLSGDLLRVFPNSGASVNGLAYDSADRNLWAHAAGGEIVKIDTRSGQIIPGAGWLTGFVNLAGQAGLSGLHDGSGRIAAVSQGTPDEWIVYDDSGAVAGGPWCLECQTGARGHHGVAAVPDDLCATLPCGDANCDGEFNGGDIDDFFRALGDPNGWQATHRGCPMLCVADINYDNRVNGGDIDPFFYALGVGSCPPP